MALIREEWIRRRSRQRARSEGASAEKLLRRLSRYEESQYDIFLSQTSRDAEIVLGVYDLLESYGFRVFCDWVDAADLDRSQVTPANAAFIRDVMSICDMLLFIDTEQADQSLWMCWELGWFDAAKGHIAILPVLRETQSYYRGREFLGLYPYVEIDEEGQLKVVRPVAVDGYGLMIFEAPNSCGFDRWRADGPSAMRPRVTGGWRYR